MNNEFDIKVNVVEGKNDLARIKGELDGVTQTANQASDAIDKMAKSGSQTQLPESMQSLLVSAQKARDALNGMATNSGVEGLRSNLGETSRLLDEIKSKSNLGLAMGQGGNYDLSAFKDLSSYASKVQSAVNGASSGIRGFGEETSRTASTVKHSNGIFSNFGGSLIRIAKLRLLRGIVRSITSAFKEGTQNIYQYSTALGSADASNFKNTMDGLASSLLKMKNAIGTAIAPLMGSIVPILQKIVGWVTAAIDALAQFFAVLNGQKTYTRAKDVSVAWQNTEAAIDGATGAAQEYKRTLLGFDEINALDAPNQGGGGSGGGGGDSVSPSMMFEEAPVATTGLQGIINGFAKMLHPVWEAVQSIPDGIDAALTVAASLFEGSPERFEEGMTKFQNIFKKNEMMNAISTWAFNASTDVQKFFEQLWTKLKLGALGAVKGVIKFLEPLLKVLGVDTKKTLKDLDTAIGDLTNELEWNEDKVKTAKKAYEEWASGKLSTAGWTLVQQAVSGCFGKAKGTAEAFYQTVKTMEKYKFDPKLLYLGMNETMTAAEKAKVGVQNLHKMVKFLESQGIDTSAIRKELAEMEGSADKTKNAVKGVQKADDNLQKSGFSLKGKKSELQGTASMSDQTKEAVNRARGALNLLQLLGFSMNGKVQQLQNVMNAGKDASGKVDGVKSSLSSLSDYKPTGFGIYDFFVNVGKWITDAWEKLKNFVSGLLGLNDINTTVKTTTEEANSRRKTNQKKDGGFVNGFKDGGFIPRFDGGGINSADIFLANENGMQPELVGHIGNRTAVANQGQMVDAMAAGVYRAMSELMQGNGTSEVNVYMDGQRIAHVVDRANRQKNRRMNVRLV